MIKGGGFNFAVSGRFDISWREITLSENICSNPPTNQDSNFPIYFVKIGEYRIGIYHKFRGCISSTELRSSFELRINDTVITLIAIQDTDLILDITQPPHSFDFTLKLNTTLLSNFVTVSAEVNRLTAPSTSSSVLSATNMNKVEILDAYSFSPHGIGNVESIPRPIHAYEAFKYEYLYLVVMSKGVPVSLTAGCDATGGVLRTT